MKNSILSAEERFEAGDLAGCLDLLFSNTGMLPTKHAEELRQRVRQKIAGGAQVSPNDQNAKRLAEWLFDNLSGYYIEGIGGIDWMEDLSEGLAEVLFLSPGHTRAAGLKRQIDDTFTLACAESEELFRVGNAMVECHDFLDCLQLLQRSEVLRLRRRQAEELRRRARNKISERITVEPDNEELKTLLEEFQSRWLSE